MLPMAANSLPSTTSVPKGSHFGPKMEFSCRTGLADPKVTSAHWVWLSGKQYQQYEMITIF